MHFIDGQLVTVCYSYSEGFAVSLEFQRSPSCLPCREHFPFFQTAPDGWKNTIRHNLCFNNSFRKTCNQLCRDGKRKSCFWHLTLDGHRRLKDEIRLLTGESLQQLERSMSRPGESSVGSVGSGVVSDSAAFFSFQI